MSERTTSRSICDSIMSNDGSWNYDNSSNGRLWKRSACERCRGQKLRCTRTQYRSQKACDRCIKCKAECNTMRSRPVGAGAPALGLVSPPESQYSLPTSEDTICNGFHQAEYQSLLEVPLELSVDPFLNNMANMVAGQSALDFGQTQVVDHAFDPSNHDISPAIQAPQVPDGATAPLNNADSTPLATPAAAKASLAQDQDKILMELFKDSLEQLSLLEDSDWDAAEVLKLSYNHDEMSAKRQPATPTHTNPLFAIVGTTTKFANLLQNFIPRKTVSPRFRHPFSTSSPSPFGSTAGIKYDSIRTSSALLILSCYLRIIAIYNLILDGVYESLMQRHKEHIESRSEERKLSLGGVAVTLPACFVGSILGALVESQLRPIEDILQCSDDHRVSPAIHTCQGEATDVGLPDETKVSDVLRACDSLGGCVSNIFNEVDGAIELKEKIAKLKLLQ